MVKHREKTIRETCRILPLHCILIPSLFFCRGCFVRGQAISQVNLRPEAIFIGEKKKLLSKYISHSECLCIRAKILILKVLQLCQNYLLPGQSTVSLSQLCSCVLGTEVYCLPLVLLMSLWSRSWQSSMNWSAMNLAKESTTLHQSIACEHQP